MTGVHHHTQNSTPTEVGSRKLFCTGLAWNHNPPELSLPSKLGLLATRAWQQIVKTTINNLYVNKIDLDENIFLEKY
jgi:hypothetical protein